MMAGWRMRVLTAADAEGCFALGVACGDPVDVPTRRTWRRWLAADAVGTIVIGVRTGRARTAAIRAVIVGHWRSAGTVAHVALVAVEPALRRRGLATALLTQLERHLPAHCRRLRLEAATDNAAAVACYLRLGFTPGEALPGYYPAAGDGRRFRRERRR
jgi:ribosomal protein S18 acetylase RimI-like enzyme